MRKFTYLFLTLFMFICGGSMAFADEITISGSEFSGGTSGSGSTVTLTKSGITITTDKGYADGTNLRVYSGGTISIIATGGIITNIDYTFSINSYKGGLTNYSNSEGTTEYEVTTSGQARISNIVITTSSVSVDPCTITWSVNGVTTDDTQNQGATITFPTSPGAILGKVFYGWTESSTVNSDGTDLTILTTDSKVPNTNSITYYAVFADESKTESTLTYGWEDNEADESKFTNTFLNSYTNSDVSAHGGSKYGSNTNSNKKGVAGNGCSIATNEKIEATYVEFYYSKSSTNTTNQTWVLETSTDGENWNANTSTYSASGATKGEWSLAKWDLNGDNVYIKITMGTANTAIRTIDDLLIKCTAVEYSNFTTEISAPTSATINIGSTGYSTYYNSEKAFIIPDDCTGYVLLTDMYFLIQEEDPADYPSLFAPMYEAGSPVQPGEPVIIYSETQGEKVLNFIEPDLDGITLSAYGMNGLLGTDVAETTKAYVFDFDFDIFEGTCEWVEKDSDDYYFYGLSYNTGDPSSVGFYWMASDGAPFTNGAHKVYLTLPKSAGAKKQILFNDKESTGINNVVNTAKTLSNGVYNLAGQKVDSNYKGIVIINGKKYLNK